MDKRSDYWWYMARQLHMEADSRKDNELLSHSVRDKARICEGAAQDIQALEILLAEAQKKSP